jgi:hypothetical protein
MGVILERRQLNATDDARDIDPILNEAIQPARHQFGDQQRPAPRAAAQMIEHRTAALKPWGNLPWAWQVRPTQWLVGHIVRLGEVRMGDRNDFIFVALLVAVLLLSGSLWLEHQWKRGRQLLGDGHRSLKRDWLKNRLSCDEHHGGRSNFGHQLLMRYGTRLGFTADQSRSMAIRALWRQVRFHCSLFAISPQHRCVTCWYKFHGAA